jgi:hypothetical protein
MRSFLLSWGTALCVAAAPAWTAFELTPASLAAFDRYLRLTEARMSREVDGASPFLWLDRQPERERAPLSARLKRGEVVSARLETRDGRAEIDAGDALIHHWIGTVLLSGVKLDRAIAFVQNYDRYPQLFAPTIQRARVISRSGDHFNVQMRTYMKKVITVVLDADYGVDYRRLGPARVYSKSVAANVFEVQSAGEPGERRAPGDQSSGFLWRLNTYCWFEERSEGTYEQCESISLTRGIPFGLGPIVRPFVNGIPRETLEFTLGRVRDGLLK